MKVHISLVFFQNDAIPHMKNFMKPRYQVYYHSVKKLEYWHLISELF